MDMQPDKANHSLAILCGGRSERLGTDKGLFCPHGDEPLVIRMLRLLGSDFRHVLVVVKDNGQAEQYHACLARHEDSLSCETTIVTDTQERADVGFAALNGIVTAVSACRTPMVTVIPVDHVGIRPIHLKKLRQADAAAYSEEGCSSNTLPFPSIWHKAQEEHLRSRQSATAFSVKAAIAAVKGRTLAVGDYLEELALNANSEDQFRSYFGSPLFDSFSRRMHYLRFSLTEVCNMACTYCLPDGFPEWYRHKAKIGLDDITTILKGFRQLGFSKVRFTGGEPTAHRDCFAAVATARKIGFEEICLTTNGLLIDDIGKWQKAGLTQLNISMDSLNPQTFQAITKSPHLSRVLNLIEASIDHGIKLKINTVLMRSKNAHEAEELIDWALTKPLTLRFIELMPTKLNDNFHNDERVFGHEIAPLLAARDLAPRITKGRSTAGPATEYARAGIPGRIGMINPLSCNFCSACNRLRVNAHGAVRLCLFGDNDTPLDLRHPTSVEVQMRQLIAQKAERHHLEEGEVGNVSTFRTIGG